MTKRVDFITLDEATDTREILATQTADIYAVVTDETPAQAAARLNGDNTKQPIWMVVEGRLARVTIPYVRETAVAIATDTEPEVSSWGANRFAALRNLATKIRAERKKAARPVS